MRSAYCILHGMMFHWAIDKEARHHEHMVISVGRFPGGHRAIEMFAIVRTRIFSRSTHVDLCYGN